MPALLAFIVGAVGNGFAFMAAQVAAKFGILVALIAAYVAAAGVFYAAINGVIGGVMPAMPSILSDAFAMLPTNTDECISIAMGARVAAYIYRQTVIVAGVKARI